MTDKLPLHLRYCKTKELWKKYGKGQATIAVIDRAGPHSEDVIKIIKAGSPQSEVVFFDWVENGLSKIPEKLEFVYAWNQACSPNKPGHQKIDIINMSLMTGDTPRLKAIIKKLDEQSVILVACSGNDSSQSFYPAEYPEVVSVGSIHPKLKKKSRFTSPYPDVWLPGEGLGPTSNQIGTSFAAPHFAFIVSCMLAKFPPKEAKLKAIEWCKKL